MRENLTKTILVKKTNIKLEKGYIYFLDDDGDVLKVALVGNPGKKLKFTVVKKLGIKKKPGSMYFVDVNGWIKRFVLEKPNK